MEKEISYLEILEIRYRRITKLLERPSAKKIIKMYNEIEDKEYHSKEIIDWAIHCGYRATDIIGIFISVLKENKKGNLDLTSVSLLMEKTVSLNFEEIYNYEIQRLKKL